MVLYKNEFRSLCKEDKVVGIVAANNFVLVLVLHKMVAKLNKDKVSLRIAKAVVYEFKVVYVKRNKHVFIRFSVL